MNRIGRIATAAPSTDRSSGENGARTAQGACRNTQAKARQRGRAKAEAKRRRLAPVYCHSRYSPGRLSALKASVSLRRSLHGAGQHFVVGVVAQALAEPVNVGEQHKARTAVTSNRRLGRSGGD